MLRLPVRLNYLIIATAASAALILVACGKSSSAAPTATPTVTVVITGIATSAPNGPGGSSASTATTTAATYSSSSSASSVTSTTATTSVNVTSATSGQQLVVTGTGGANLRIRATPGGKEIAAVPEGTKLIALGSAPQKQGNYTWIHIRTLTGITGWVAATYVAPAG